LTFGSASAKDATSSDIKKNPPDHSDEDSSGFTIAPRLDALEEESSSPNPIASDIPNSESSKLSARSPNLTVTTQQLVTAVPPLVFTCTSLYPNKIVEFINAHVEYVAVYHVDISLAQAFPANLRELVRGQCCPDVTRLEILMLDDASFVKLLKAYCKPSDQYSWGKAMKKSLVFPNVRFAPTLVNMSDFVTSTCIYAYNFMELYHFMDCNNARIMPVLYQSNLSSLSLIAVFLDQFPNGFGRYLHNQFYKAFSKSTFGTIEDYIKDFVKQLRDFQAKGKYLLEMNTVLSHYGKEKNDLYVTNNSKVHALSSLSVSTAPSPPLAAASSSYPPDDDLNFQTSGL